MSEVSAGRSLAYYAAEVGLNQRQRAFVEAYLADPERDQVLAAKKAGYPHPQTQSYEILKSSKVKQFLLLADKKIDQAVAKRFNAAVMKPAELRARLSDQARGSLLQFFDADGNLDLERLKAEDKGHLVKKLMVAKDGDRAIIKAEAESPQGAMKELASHYGLAKDKNPQGNTLNITAVLGSLKPDEREALKEGIGYLYSAMLKTGQVVDVEAEEVE